MGEEKGSAGPHPPGRLRRAQAWLAARAAPAAVSASSFHLWWQLEPAEPLVEVAVTLEVLEPPSVDRLYFWALQVGFTDGRRPGGAGHTGLQWHGRDSGARAVNWGGYHDRATGGAELAGTASPLPRRDQFGNTVAYPWEPGRPYRFRVAAGALGWRATVTDLATGEATAIRELLAPGPYLSDPVVWSEVFAGCEAPTVKVRWTALEAVGTSGAVHSPRAVRTSYQAAAAGGCPNTDSSVDAHGLVQTTATARLHPDGARLGLPGPG